MRWFVVLLALCLASVSSSGFAQEEEPVEQPVPEMVEEAPPPAEEAPAPVEDAPAPAEEMAVPEEAAPQPSAPGTGMQICIRATVDRAGNVTMVEEPCPPDAETP